MAEERELNLLKPEDIKLMDRKSLEVIAHYGNFFGSASRSFKFDNLPSTTPDPLYIIEFNSMVENEPLWIYLTAGLSRSPMPNPHHEGIERRVELLIYSKQSKAAELVELLLNLAVHPFQNNVFYDINHTTRFPSGEFIEGSPLTSAIFAYPIFEDEEFTTIVFKDGDHAHILWVLPVYEDERKFFKQYGYEALVDLFIENKIDNSDLLRSCVVNNLEEI